MNLNLKQDRSLMAYIIVSVIAILWNLMTIGHSLPWCDEVMLLDTNATMHYYGEWATTAYNDYGQGTRPFNVYMPLYNWLMYIWVSIFGFSMLVIRTFNLVFAFMLGWALLHLAKLINRQNFSKVTVILYALCFWCTDVMMMTYRMSRPEIVGSLMTVIFAIYLYKTLTSGRKYIWQMILFAALSILAGIQSALYIVLGLIFVAFFFRPLNRLITPSICCVIGLCLGFLAALLHMIYFQEGRAFIICIMNSSAVIMKIWGGIRSIIYPLLGKEVTPLGIPVSNEGDISLIEKIMGIFAYLGASVLFISNIILIISNRVWKNIQEYKMPVLCFLFSIFVVIGYNLAGRYTSYYKWTAILPMLLGLLFWSRNVKQKINTAIIGITSLILLVTFVIKYPLYGETPCDRIKAFVEKQNFKPTDRIAAPFCTFYALKPTNRFTYFYQIYPQNLIGDVDYIIIPTSDKEYSYNKAGMNKYLNEKQKDTRLCVEKIDFSLNPNIALYKITKK